MNQEDEALLNRLKEKYSGLNNPAVSETDRGIDSLELTVCASLCAGTQWTWMDAIGGECTVEDDDACYPPNSIRGGHAKCVK